MPRALMAKLSSLVSRNSRRCFSFITPKTSSRAFSGARGVVVTGTTLPWTLIDGGTPAVINRSDAFFSTMSFSKRSKSIAVSNSFHESSRRAPGHHRRAIINSGLKVFRHPRAGASHFTAHHAPCHQVGQALVHGLHTQ